MEGFFLENLNGDILDVNDAFCSMLGYSRRELLSMNIRDIDVGIMEHPERFEQKTNATREAGGALIEVRHRRKDGTIIDVLVSIKYLDIDEGFFFCFHRDITERKKIYQKLKESEDRYRSLIDLGTNIGEAVIMLQDIDGREGIQTFVSDQWPIITGYSKEELLGMSFFDLVNPRDRRFSLERHRKKVSGESIPNLFEITITRRDGVEAPVEITSARSLYNNQPVNVVYIRDITQRKQAEKEIKQYQEHLEDLVKARTAELQKQIEQRTEFTRALVHEIKTPLASVLVAGELLSSELREEPLRSLSKHLYDGAEELNVRIDELLDLAKGEIGTLKLKYTIVDLQKVLRELNNWLELQVYKKKQHLVLNIAPSLPPLRADEKRLKQILLNLLDNALKFTPEGGIITLRVFEKNSNIVFEIKDTGSGMTEDEQKNIFQAYYRVERDRDRFSGLGLGLALSKTLVELHKGRIWVNSRKNKGSTFSFSLPPAG